MSAGGSLSEKIDNFSDILSGVEARLVCHLRKREETVPALQPRRRIPTTANANASSDQRGVQSSCLQVVIYPLLICHQTSKDWKRILYIVPGGLMCANKLQPRSMRQKFTKQLSILVLQRKYMEPYRRAMTICSCTEELQSRVDSSLHTCHINS